MNSPKGFSDFGNHRLLLALLLVVFVVVVVAVGPGPTGYQAAKVLGPGSYWTSLEKCAKDGFGNCKKEQSIQVDREYTGVTEINGKVKPGGPAVIVKTGDVKIEVLNAMGNVVCSNTFKGKEKQKNNDYKLSCPSVGVYKIRGTVSNAGLGGDYLDHFDARFDYQKGYPVVVKALGGCVKAKYKLAGKEICESSQKINFGKSYKVDRILALVKAGGDAATCRSFDTDGTKIEVTAFPSSRSYKEDIVKAQTYKLFDIEVGGGDVNEVVALASTESTCRFIDDLKVVLYLSEGTALQPSTTPAKSTPKPTPTKKEAPFKVTVSHSPASPTVGQKMTFTATSDKSVDEIFIYLDGISPKQCFKTTSCVYETSYSSAGKHDYNARASLMGNKDVYDPAAGAKPFTVSQGSASGNKPPIIKEFTANPQTGAGPLKVTFSGTATDADNDKLQSTLYYDYNGDKRLTRKGPITAGESNYLDSYTYPTLSSGSKSYLARLEVVDEKGGYATKDIPIVISAPSGGRGPSAPKTPTTPELPTGENLKPTGKISVTPAKGSAPLKVTFKILEAADADGKIASYVWDYDDNEKQDKLASQGEVVKYTYTEEGFYYPTLMLTDNLGLQAVFKGKVEVTAPTSTENQVPYATFSTDTTGLPPLSMGFDAGGSFDYVRSGVPGSIVSYNWDFGDGATLKATKTYITHAYAKAGTYTVTLTVTDNGGLSASKTQSVVITKVETPEVKVSLSSGSVNVGEQVTVTATATGRTDIAIVEITEDGGIKKRCSGTSCVYAVSYSSAGTRYFSAYAKDSSGNFLVRTDTPVPVQVKAPSGTVIVSAPATVAAGGSATITARAYSDVGITKIEIYYDGAFTTGRVFDPATADTSDFQKLLGFVSAGTHKYYAQATDKNGNIIKSAEKTITAG